MKIHAIQTGFVRVKTTFQRGNADRSLPLAMISLFTDQPAIDLPIYAWVIEHDEGIIVVDTGENAGTRVSPPGEAFIKPEEALDSQLEAHGIRPQDVSKIVLTHLHSDHIGGIEKFRGVQTCVSAYDHAVLSSPIRRRISGLVNPIPTWLETRPIAYTDGIFGAFPHSAKLTQRGDVIAVPTPGHTAGHQSIFVLDGDTQILIAGDLTYSDNALLARKLEGLSFAKPQHLPTIERVLSHAQQFPTVYLPSHDWQSAVRLEQRQVIQPKHYSTIP